MNWPVEECDCKAVTAALQGKLGDTYTQRNACAAALARLTIERGGKAGVGRDIAGYMMLYVDTPNGQVSWHFWEHDEWLLQGLPEYGGEWDGTFKSRDGKWATW